MQREIAFADRMSKQERENRLSWEKRETSRLDSESKYLHAESEKRKQQNEEDLKSAKIKTMQL